MVQWIEIVLSLSTIQIHYPISTDSFSTVVALMERHLLVMHVPFAVHTNVSLACPCDDAAACLSRYIKSNNRSVVRYPTYSELV
jgi:hypothetical protein